VKPASYRWTDKGDAGNTRKKNREQYQRANSRLQAILEALLQIGMPLHVTHDSDSRPDAWERQCR
jgi:hypothetical protein